MQLTKSQVEAILKGAPVGVDKTKLLDGLIQNGYDLEGVDSNARRQQLQGQKQLVQSITNAPTPDPTSGASTGIFTGPLSLLAVPGQLASKVVAQAVTAPSQQNVQNNIETMRKMVDNALARANQATTPEEKNKWLAVAQTGSAGMQDSSKNINDLQSEIMNRQRIETPLGTIPALSNDPLRNTQQVLGRGAQTVAFMGGPSVGPTLAGGLLGFGQGMEEGGSAGDIAGKTAMYAAGGKLLGFGAGKLAETGVGQRILSSKAMGVVNKIMTPFMASPATGTAGMAVDSTFAKFGQFADKLYSPSLYLKGASSVMRPAGEAVGLLKTPEQSVAAAKEKLAQGWESVRLQTKKTFTQVSPNVTKTLADEGIVWDKVGGKMQTGAQQEVLKLKIEGESKLLDTMLVKGGTYSSLNEAKQAAINNITKNFQGVERDQALAAFDKQFNSLVADYKSLIGTSAAGDDIVPTAVLNRMKSYFWSQGYSSGMLKSETVVASAMRSAGNGLKVTVDSSLGAVDPELRQAALELNTRLGKLSEAETFLEQVNGNVLPFGRMGKYFAATTGAIIGSAGGPVGSLAGAMTAEKLVDIYTNPKYTVGRAAKIIQEAMKTAPQEVERAMELIKQIDAALADRLALPPGGTTTQLGPRTFSNESSVVPAQKTFGTDVKTGRFKRVYLSGETPPKAEGAIPKTTPTSLDPLATEARKYKSAEEFVRNTDLTIKDNPAYLYRGTGGRNAQAQMLVRGTHFTDTLSTAEEFAGTAHIKAPGGLITTEKMTSAYKLSPNAKIADLDKVKAFLAEKKIIANTENITSALKDAGYDGAVGTLPGKGKEFMITNPRMVKDLNIPSSQLTDFYNKAVGKKTTR